MRKVKILLTGKTAWFHKVIVKDNQATVIIEDEDGFLMWAGISAIQFIEPPDICENGRCK